MQHHVHAITPGIDHGHVLDIERRLMPWAIEHQVIESRGQVDWHLSSARESERDMLNYLRSAVKRSTGRDCTRVSDVPPG